MVQTRSQTNSFKEGAKLGKGEAGLSSRWHMANEQTVYHQGVRVKVSEAEEAGKLFRMSGCGCVFSAATVSREEQTQIFWMHVREDWHLDEQYYCLECGEKMGLVHGVGLAHEEGKYWLVTEADC